MTAKEVMCILFPKRPFSPYEWTWEHVQCIAKACALGAQADRLIDGAIVRQSMHSRVSQSRANPGLHIFYDEPWWDDESCQWGSPSWQGESFPCTQDGLDRAIARFEELKPNVASFCKLGISWGSFYPDGALPSIIEHKAN